MASVSQRTRINATSAGPRTSWLRPSSINREHTTPPGSIRRRPNRSMRRRLHHPVPVVSSGRFLLGTRNSSFHFLDLHRVRLNPRTAQNYSIQGRVSLRISGSCVTSLVCRQSGRFRLIPSQLEMQARLSGPITLRLHLSVRSLTYVPGRVGSDDNPTRTLGHWKDLCSIRNWVIGEQRCLNPHFV
jgi:hypothetical protein